MLQIPAVVVASFVGLFLCSLCEASLYGVTRTQIEVLRRGRGRVFAPPLMTINLSVFRLKAIVNQVCGQTKIAQTL